MKAMNIEPQAKQNKVSSMTTTIKPQFSIAILLLSAFIFTGCQSDENKAIDYLNSAQEYFKAGDYALASVELKNAIRKDSRLVSAYMLQAEIFEKNHQRESTHAFLATALQLEPEHIEANLKIARLYASSRNIPTAQKYLNSATEAGANDFERHLTQSMIYQFSEKPEKAEAEVRLALEIEPNSTDANHLLASILKQGKKYSQALNIIHSALLRTPNSESILVLSSELYTLTGDFLAAAEQTRRLTRLLPNELRYHYLLSALLDQAGNSEAAEQALRIAIKENPNNPKAKIALAGYNSKHNDNQKAIALLSSYVESDPDRANAELRLILGELYQQENLIAEASGIYLRLSQENNKYAATAKNKLALLALKGNRRQDALDILNEILKTDFNNIEALTSRAVIYLWDRNTDKAITDLLNAVRENQKHELALTLLAQAYQQSDDNDLATITLKKLLKINPKNKNALIFYSQLEADNNNFNSAINTLKQYLANNPSSRSAQQALLNIYLSAKQWPQAQQLAIKISAETQQAEFSNFINARILKLKGQHEESIQLFTSLIEKNSFISLSLRGVIANYQAMDNSEKGLTFIKEYSAANPDDLFVTELLVKQYQRNQQLPSAQKLLLSTLQNNPNWSHGHLLLAKTYTIQRQHQKAITSGLQSLESANQSASIELLLLLASSYDHQGQLEQAVYYYRKALDRSPNIDAAANNLALLLAGDGSDKKKLKEAFVIAKRFEYSTQAAFIDTLGWIYFLRNDYPPAVELLKKATKAKPNDAGFSYHLGATYFKLFEFSKARKYLEKSRHLAEDKIKFEGYDEVIKMLDKLSSS
jgi:tetratricopeptide (TPR) repeat protein